MSYRLFAYIDDEDETAPVSEIDSLLLDGMLVADRMLEDVIISIKLSEDRKELIMGFDNPELLPPLIDKEAILLKAKDIALHSDQLDTPDGRIGVIWTDGIPHGDQMGYFPQAPVISDEN